LLACVVCAGGYAAPADAQPAHAEDVCQDTPPHDAPAADPGGPASSDFAEQDDEDDVDQEPPALNVPGLSRMRWERVPAPALLPSASALPGHHALDPRPPR